MLEALKAAETSWPRVELVRMERRWRGLVEDIVAITEVMFEYNGAVIVVVVAAEVVELNRCLMLVAVKWRLWRGRLCTFIWLRD